MALPTAISYQIPDHGIVNRVQWQIDPSRAVILVHDMQKYFVRAFAAGQSPIQGAIVNIAAICDAARSHSVPVVFTAQPGDQEPAQRALLTDFWGAGLVADDAHIIDELAPSGGDTLLTKWRYSAFARTDLADRMRCWGRDQLVIVGVYAHIGVLTTALDAFMRDLQTFIVCDAVADFSADEHAMALQYAASRCACVVPTDVVVGACDRNKDAVTTG